MWAYRRLSTSTISILDYHMTYLSHPMRYTLPKTNMNSEGSGLKFENHTQSSCSPSKCPWWILLNILLSSFTFTYEPVGCEQISQITHACAQNKFFGSNNKFDIFSVNWNYFPPRFGISHSKCLTNYRLWLLSLLNFMWAVRSEKSIWCSRKSLTKRWTVKIVLLSIQFVHCLQKRQLSSYLYWQKRF